MAQTLARIFVHVVFSTKDRAPLPREPIRSADLSYAPSGLASGFCPPRVSLRFTLGYNPAAASRLIRARILRRNPEKPSPRARFIAPWTNTSICRHRQGCPGRVSWTILIFHALRLATW